MRVWVKVVPGSGREEVREGDPMVVYLKEPAEEGRANRELVKVLSRYFGARVRIVKGLKSRRKLVEVEG